jgi:exosortase E/protease (VPEID-CTERM system)
VARGGSRARALALGALLLGEGLVLGVTFDSASAERLPPGWWTSVLGLAGAAMPAAAAILAAIVLVTWSTLRRPSPSPSPSPSSSPSHRRLPFLLLHLVSFIALYLLCQRLFDEQLPPPARPGVVVAGWLASAALLAITWLGSLVPLGRVPSLARTYRAPLGGAVALGVAAFAVGRLSQGLWLPLRRATFALSAAALRLFLPDATVDPASLTIGTDLFEVEISAECSGYEGVGLTSVFVLASLWLFRDRWRFPRAFLLLALATAIPWLANAGRLVALVALGTYVSPDLALGGFHSYAGSILFCAVALGIVAVALGSPWFSRVPRAEARAAGPNPAAPYLVPFLALVLAGMIARAFATAGSEPLYPLRAVAAVVALAAYAPRLRAIAWRPSALAAPMGISVELAWMAIAWVLPGGAGPAVAAPPGSAALAVRLGTTVVVVPIVEELAFRGFLARRISAADFGAVPAARLSVAGVLVSSLAFGLLHQRLLAGVVAGIAYALVYRWRGVLGDAVVAHAATNAALVIAAWLTGNWGLWL